MIHSAPSRQWYVDDYLIPSMLEQGISKDDIVIWCDTDKKGNLRSCMDSFIFCGENPTDGTWHIQDDVIISRDFALTTKKYNYGIVAGFVVEEWGPDWTKAGTQIAKELWYSFPCIRIPDNIAGECAKWFFTDIRNRKSNQYTKFLESKKNDDVFFSFFLRERYPRKTIINLKPNIVDHVDYLIGGSLINTEREKTIYRAAYWEDETLVEQLENRLNNK